jgi:glycerol-3-phosphate acyltransferase PlsY
VEVAWGLVVPSYLLGTFPTAMLVGRREGHDPTREGSGNPGASNVYRTSGRRAGAVVLAGDLCKGAAAAGIGLAAGSRGVGVACGIAAVVGHIFPLGRIRHGGKGVATGAGVALVLHPVASLGAIAIWLVLFAVTRTASVASIAGVVALPIGAALSGARGPEVAAIATCAALIVFRHRGNISRLRAGRERPLEDR